MPSTFVDRMVRAARLDAQVYEEVEADAGANGQAVAVVVMVAAATGIGAGRGGIGVLFGASLVGLLGWVIWALLTWWIGTRILPEPNTRASYGELLRTIAFSSSPGLLRVLGIVPGLQGLTMLVTGIWMLVAMVVAVRQALDYSGTGRAIGVCLIGWLVQLFLLAFFMTMISGGRAL